MSNDTLFGGRNLWRIGLALSVLLLAVGVFASVAYAATVHGTSNADWGKAKDHFSDPPGCGAGCGNMIHGTGGQDTIYGHQGWDYIGAGAGGDVVHGGLGMEIIQGEDGDDLIFGDRGHDHVFGGPGNDRIHVEDDYDEPDNVEQVIGDGGRDLCVVDEDPGDGVIAHKSCETLRIESVPNLTGATKLYYTHAQKDRDDAVPGNFYPGTYHLK